MAQVLVTTVPFAAHNRLPLDLLDSLGVSYEINPLDSSRGESHPRLS